MAQNARTERTLTPRVHTRPGPEDTQGGLVQGREPARFPAHDDARRAGPMGLGGVGAFWPSSSRSKVSAFGGKINAGVIEDFKDGDVKVFREGKF